MEKEAFKALLEEKRQVGEKIGEALGQQGTKGLVGALAFLHQECTNKMESADEQDDKESYMLYAGMAEMLVIVLTAFTTAIEVDQRNAQQAAEASVQPG